MQSKPFSREDWQEWQASPTTEAVRDALRRMLDHQQAAATSAYWAGRAWPEAERIALSRMVAWHDDFFTATYEEITQAMEIRE